jgi:predicted MPP superfamily phosphohydrolase
MIILICINIKGRAMENLLQIKKTEINIGLDREYKLFQISDVHMACLDENSSMLDISENKRSREKWDELKVEFANESGELCDERYDMEASELFELLTRHALDIGADALILSGDMFDRVSDSNVRYMERFLANYPIPVIYCPGNHDWMNEKGEHLNQYDRLTGISTSLAADSWDFGEFEIVAIDNGEKKITDYQISYIKNKLEGNKKIILVVHAPLNIGKFGSRMEKEKSPYFLMGVEGDCENCFKFNKLISENSNKLIAVLAGHVHCFYEDSICEDLNQYTTSSALIGAGREIIIK